MFISCHYVKRKKVFIGKDVFIDIRANLILTRMKVSSKIQMLKEKGVNIYSKRR